MIKAPYYEERPNNGESNDGVFLRSRNRGTRILPPEFENQKSRRRIPVAIRRFLLRKKKKNTVRHSIRRGLVFLWCFSISFIPRIGSVGYG